MQGRMRSARSPTQHDNTKRICAPTGRYSPKTNNSQTGITGSFASASKEPPIRGVRSVVVLMELRQTVSAQTTHEQGTRGSTGHSRFKHSSESKRRCMTSLSTQLLTYTSTFITGAKNTSKTVALRYQLPNMHRHIKVR